VPCVVTVEQEIKMESTSMVFFPENHPGRVVQDVLETIGVSREKLAEHIGVPVSLIDAVCDGLSGITLDLAARLGRAFGTSTAFWYELQREYDEITFDESAFDEIIPLRAGRERKLEAA
jgi:addiction module HigA family antidote